MYLLQCGRAGDTLVSPLHSKGLWRNITGSRSERTPVKMKPATGLLVFSVFIGNLLLCEAQGQGQFPPIATGEIITSAFQIPIQTLNAVQGLLQATRGRFNAIQQRYAIQQQMHPNHHLNPTFSLPDRRRSQYNSKALYQDRSTKGRQSRN